MPFDLAGLSALRGAIYGLVICWVILGAIWFYQITVLSGRFEDLRRTFDRLGGGDLRIQAILIKKKYYRGKSTERSYKNI